MTNIELAKMLQEFVDSQNDSDKDEWYGTNKDYAEWAIDGFVNYMQHEGIRITLPTKD